MCCPRRSDRQRGAALIVALLVFALAAALMVGLQRDFSLQVQRAGNASMSEQMWAYALGAEALAAIALRADVDMDAERPEPVDDLTELWAQPPTPYALDEGGWLSGRIDDLQGRLNVNALGIAAGGAGDNAPRFTIEQKLMIRLLQALEGLEITREEAIALTEAISDFIDADDIPRLNGGEDSSYTNGDFPYRAANRPLASVSELRAVQGMTADIYRALAPLVTVWPLEGEKLNWRTAPLPVIRAFNADDALEPMPLEEAERMVESRAQGLYADLDGLFDDAFLAGRDTAALRATLTDRSGWFLLTSEVEIADRNHRLYSVLARNGRNVTVVYRSTSEP